MDNRVTQSYPLPRVDRQIDSHVREPGLSDRFDTFMQLAESAQVADDARVVSAVNAPNSLDKLNALSLSGLPSAVSGAAYTLARERRVIQALRMGALLSKRIQSISPDNNATVRFDIVDDPSGIVDIELSRNKNNQWSIKIGLLNTYDPTIDSPDESLDESLSNSPNEAINPPTLVALQEEISKALIECGVQLDVLRIELRAAPTQDGDA